jgi:hypothetical protein
MQTGYQNQRKNGRQQVLTALMVACSLGASTAESPFAEMSDSTVLQATTKRTIVERTYQLSPPAIQFDEAGTLHLAWFEKNGDVPALKTVRISDRGNVVGETVQVNPVGAEPDALHQAPGLAAGKDNQLFMTWSTGREAACLRPIYSWPDRRTEV